MTDGYTMGDGQFAPCTPLHLQASTTKTSTGAGDAVEVGSKKVARLKLTVTASAGASETLDVTVQGSDDPTFATNYNLGAFTQATGAGSEIKCFPCCRFMRGYYTLGSTGQNGAVTQTGSGPAVTLSGTPAADYAFTVEITTGGNRGTAEFRWKSSVAGSWTEGVATAADCTLGATGVHALFAADTAGASGAVTKVGAGPDLGAVGGEPNAVYSMKIEVTTGGGRGVGAYNWSTDNGVTWKLATPKVIAADGVETLTGSGISITFADDTYVDGDTYAWETTAPIEYQDGTTYTWNSYTDDPAQSFTFDIDGEAA